MQLGDALNDGKPKTRASGLASIASPEALKNVTAFVLGDARSLVENAYRSVLLDDELDRGFGWRVIYRIFREISDGAAQHLRISPDPNCVRRAEQGDVLALRQCQWCEKFRDIGGHGSKVGFLGRVD